MLFGKPVVAGPLFLAILSVGMKTPKAGAMTFGSPNGVCVLSAGPSGNFLQPVRWTQCEGFSGGSRKPSQRSQPCFLLVDVCCWFSIFGACIFITGVLECTFFFSDLCNNCVCGSAPVQEATTSVVPTFSAAVVSLHCISLLVWELSFYVERDSQMLTVSGSFCVYIYRYIYNYVCVLPASTLHGPEALRCS